MLNRLQRLWQLHPPVALVVGASPSACLATLDRAARPSTQRLHLRDLFRDGRRYVVQPTPDGFKLSSTSRPSWSYRRTPVAATVSGTFATFGDDITLIRLRARLRLSYMLYNLLFPLFFASIFVYMPWDRTVITVIVTAMFALSWVGHRFNAALQVNEMVFFVQKALEDLPPADVAQLPPGAEVVIKRDEFLREWQRFYEEKREE